MLWNWLFKLNHRTPLRLFDSPRWRSIDPKCWPSSLHFFCLILWMASNWFRFLILFNHDLPPAMDHQHSTPSQSSPRSWSTICALYPLHRASSAPFPSSLICAGTGHWTASLRRWVFCLARVVSSTIQFHQVAAGQSLLDYPISQAEMATLNFILMQSIWWFLMTHLPHFPRFLPHGWWKIRYSFPRSVLHRHRPCSLMNALTCPLHYCPHQSALDSHLRVIESDSVPSQDYLGFIIIIIIVIIIIFMSRSSRPGYYWMAHPVLWLSHPLSYSKFSNHSIDQA